MPYTPQSWLNLPSNTTPISAARLGVMETGIQAGAQNLGFLVASVDAPTATKNRADYVCDGANDEVEINAAITAAATANYYSYVQLTGGKFVISSAILMRTGVTLAGVGIGTEIRASGNTPTGTGTGTYAAMIKAFDINTHVTRVTAMWLNGNYASGGNCHAIGYTGVTSGDSLSGRPDTNPDPDHTFDNMLITGMMTGTRHAVYMDTDQRGTMISMMQIRNCSGNGIYFNGSPDSHIQMVHMGGIAGNGYQISGGNVKLTNCKAFYCDGDGFTISSGRGILSACESQDNNVGFRFDGSPCVAVGICADTCQTDGIIVSTSQLVLNGFTIFNRGNGRYGTTTRGLNFDASYSDCTVVGEVTPANITTKISGTVGSRSFMRVTDGSSLTAVG